MSVCSFLFQKLNYFNICDTCIIFTSFLFINNMIIKRALKLLNLSDIEGI
ncbi:Protein of unknown function [Gryllus bimaculatus]|nr:Protein of unknown function [Gryllus bimaculatus]